MNALALRSPLAVAPRRSSVISRAGEGAQINKTVDKASPKVVHTVATSEIEKQAVYCRCWKSGTFPLCNGAHVAHNTETGDNVGPLIIKKD